MNWSALNAKRLVPPVINYKEHVCKRKSNSTPSSYLKFSQDAKGKKRKMQDIAPHK